MIIILNFIIILFLSLNNSLMHAATEAPTERMTSETLAATDAYGNKYKRLAELHQMVNQLGVTGVEVPEPHGLTSDSVVQFLQKDRPQVFDLWKELGTRYETSASKADFLSDPGTQQLLTEIQAEITSAFEQLK